MPLIIWSEKYDIGIEEIDTQHRILADVINSLGDSKGKDDERQTTDNALYTLKSYSDFHFYSEEELMAEYKYPLLKDHVLEHEKFTDQITLFSRKFQSSKNNFDFGLLEYLKKWFIKHTQGNDRKYVQFFEDSGALEEKEIINESGESRKTKHLKSGLTKFIVWGDKYQLGIEEIDDQHMKLADAINALHASMGNTLSSKTVIDGLKNLFEFTNKHLKFEENLLEKYGYKELPKHKEQHAEFKAQVDNLKLTFRNHGTVVDFNMVVFLKNWLLEHILVQDKEYVAHVKEQLEQ